VSFIDVSDPNHPILLKEVAHGESGLTQLDGAAFLHGNGSELYVVAEGANAVTILSSTLTLDLDGDRFGVSVSRAGDVNGDGYADLIIGAPFDDHSGTNSGSAYVFSGATSNIFYRFDGDSSGDEFGYSVSGAGDVNNDGFNDLKGKTHYIGLFMCIHSYGTFMAYSLWLRLLMDPTEIGSARDSFAGTPSFLTR